MNRLRDLLDTPDSRIYCDPGVSLGRVMRDVRGFGEQAVSFWLGELDGVVDRLAIIPELCRLPYPCCWFEMRTWRGEVAMDLAVLAFEGGDLSFSGALFIRAFGRWALMGSVQAPSLADAMMQTDVVDAEGVDAIQTVVYAVKAFLSALHCCNVQRKQHVPDAKLQKARAKRGKAPLFSFWTLELDGRGDDPSPPLGGTHASPRVHLRRGHPVQYKPGRWTWRQAHVVGNKQAGMVSKDYRAGPGLSP